MDDGKELWLVDVEVDLTHHVREVEQTAAWSDTQFHEWVASRYLGWYLGWLGPTQGTS